MAVNKQYSADELNGAAPKELFGVGPKRLRAHLQVFPRVSPIVGRGYVDFGIP